MKWLTFFLVLLLSCSQKKRTDLIIYNATIYTVDSSFNMAEAIAIEKGNIIAIGKTNDILKNYDASMKTDAGGHTIYPGFIDAHCHFYRYALGLKTVDLSGTTSWQEVIERVKTFADKNPGGWLIGRGWDQNDWTIKEFPTKDQLDEHFPSRPVLLTRIDGHAAIANQQALNLAGIVAGETLTGGEVELKAGRLTGILIDNAVAKVSKAIPLANSSDITEALMQAQQKCFETGLTTVDDCGIDFNEALKMDSLQKNGRLKMRVYAMLSDNKKNYDFLFATGPMKTDRLNVRAFKVYADGALGSRGACLLASYTDKPGHYGFLLSNAQHFDSVAQIIYQKGFQMCTHAIGDSGNRVMLNIYSKYLKGKNDRRWRIEHAQVINENDFSLFGRFSVIPSVQPTHATSDMYWAADCLGNQRVKGAYAFRQLLLENNWIPLGTDFPVEDISPFKTFFAAIARKDAKGWPAGGYQPENALDRKQALMGMTIWAAKSNFEEKEKGSLEPGKFADFIILDHDIMKTPEGDILKTKVLKTYINGELVFERK